MHKIQQLISVDNPYMFLKATVNNSGKHASTPVFSEHVAFGMCIYLQKQPYTVYAQDKTVGALRGQTYWNTALNY